MCWKGILNLSLKLVVLLRPKHPIKVHVWAGISLEGPTKICIFEGIMDAELYEEILRSTLLPFISQKFPRGHRFMQDTRSILRVVPEHFLQRMWLTGGKRLLSHPISTLLRTCGTSLKSTFVKKLSYAQKKN